MSEKIQVEFKFKIGDVVKNSEGEIFRIDNRRFEASTDHAVRWYFGPTIEEGGRLGGTEEGLTLVEPPLTIKEVLEEANSIHNTIPAIWGCPACKFVNRIQKRGIVP